MDSAYLASIGPCGWEGLDLDAINEWLWCDTTAPGVHVANRLPARPADVTHIWGWGPGTWLRARVDVGIPAGGVIGAVLHLEPTEASTEVDVRSQDSPIWSPLDGRVNLVAQADLDPAVRHAIVKSVVVTSTDASGNVSYMPLTFVELAS